MNKLEFLEVSAKTRENVDLLFRKLTEIVLEKIKTDEIDPDLVFFTLFFILEQKLRIWGWKKGIVRNLRFKKKKGIAAVNLVQIYFKKKKISKNLYYFITTIFLQFIY